MEVHASYDFDSIVPIALQRFRNNWEKKYPEMMEAVDVMTELGTAYMTSGKRIRPIIMTLMTSDYMGGSISSEMLSMLQHLGIYMEAMGAAPTILDDMMDECFLRRGIQCWHLRDGIGIRGCMDSACITEFAIDQMLEVLDWPDPISIVHSYTKPLQDINVGQIVDWVISRICRKDPLNEIKTDMHRELAFRKSSAAFEVPVAVALIFGGVTDPHEIAESISITMALGWLFQIENDYLDIYGVTVATGKDPTDIKEASLNWITAVAIEMASEEQKEIIKKNIGIDDKECIATVMSVFSELDMYKVYKDYEEWAYKAYMKRIEKLNSKGSRSLKYMAGLFYRRER